MCTQMMPRTGEAACVPAFHTLIYWNQGIKDLALTRFDGVGTPKKTPPLLLLVCTSKVAQWRREEERGEEKEPFRSHPTLPNTFVLSCLYGTEFPTQNISEKVAGWLLKIRVDANQELLNQ